MALSEPKELFRLLEKKGFTGVNYNGFLTLTADFILAVQAGFIPGMEIIKKFGKNDSVNTTPVPIATGGLYPTPMSGNTIRVKAGGDVGDDASGIGAREITLIGLDNECNKLTKTISTAGVDASDATLDDFLRLWRFFVSQSGTYATAAGGSHQAAITLENGGGGTDWAKISDVGFPHGQSQIGAYSVPANKTAFIFNVSSYVDSGKTANLLFFQRENIDVVTAPFSPMNLKEELFAQQGQILGSHNSYYVVPEKTDVGFMGFVDSTVASVAVRFDILELDNTIYFQD